MLILKREFMEFWTFMEFMATSALVLKLAYQLKSGLVMPMLQDKDLRCSVYLYFCFLSFTLLAHLLFQCEQAVHSSFFFFLSIF